MLREGNLPRDRRRSFLLAAFICSQRPIHIVEADNARLKTVIFLVVAAELLGKQLLPSVARLRISWNRVGFLQGRYVRVILLVLRIDTGGGGKQETARAIDPGRFQHVRVNQNVITGNVSMVSGDVTDATHVRGQVVNLVDIPSRGQAVVPAAEVEDGELIRRTGLKIRHLEIGASHPKSIIFQPPHQVVPNKPTRAGYQDPGFSGHAPLPVVRLKRETSILSDAKDKRQGRYRCQRRHQVFARECALIVCNLLHGYVRVIPTKEPFSNVVSVRYSVASGMVFAGMGLALPRKARPTTLVGRSRCERP